MTSSASALQIIDLRFINTPGVIAAFLLRSPDEAALIETGPGSTAETLLAALRQVGVGLDEIRHLLVTHVHLDHAGAAGLLLDQMPNARLYVSEVGAPHLIDPTKLIASASRIYGSMMKPLWGDILPVAADRVVTLRDGDRLEIAGHEIEVLYTPGHASHHLAYRDMEDGAIFTGDVAGGRLEGCSYVRPLTPPPDLDLELWESSLDRLASLAAPAFYATHFGRCEGTEEHLAELRARLRAWERLVRERMEAGEDRVAIARALQRQGDQELAERIGEDADRASQAAKEIVRRYEVTSAYTMNVAGYERYLRKRYPALVPPAAPS